MRKTPQEILGVITAGRSQDSFVKEMFDLLALMMPRTSCGIFLIKGRRVFYQSCHIFGPSSYQLGTRRYCDGHLWGWRVDY
jgi:hypothetical protein